VHHVLIDESLEACPDRTEQQQPADWVLRSPRRDQPTHQRERHGRNDGLRECAGEVDIAQRGPIRDGERDREPADEKGEACTSPGEDRGPSLRHCSVAATTARRAGRRR
jgi:hypothetical protein